MRHPTFRRSALPLLLALALGSLPLHAEQGLASTPAGVAVSTEATTVAGWAALSVRVFAGDRELKSAFGGAMVTVNRTNVGWAPWSSGQVAPGRYLVKVAADGWYPAEISLNLAEKTLTKVSFTLKRMTGFLHGEFSPADAELVIGGKTVDTGLLELPIGHYTATVRRFAYRERDIDFDIYEGRATTLVAALEKAPFEVSNLRAGRSAFDPGNLGVLGTSLLSFRVTSYGSGWIEVFSPEGGIVARLDLPSFTDWEQSVAWNGRRQEGRHEVLPDGQYLVRLSAVEAGQPGSPSPAPIVAETTVTIDSSLALSPFGTAGAVPGLLYFPDPRRTGGGQAAVDLGFAAASDFAASLGTGTSFDLGFAAAAGQGGLGLALQVSTANDSNAGVPNLGAALSWRSTLSGPQAGREGSSLALFAKAAWTGSLAAIELPGAGLPADALSLELDLPWAWQSGDREGAFITGIAPGVLGGYSPQGGTFTAAPRLRAGAFLSTRGVQLGLSALAAPLSFVDLRPSSLPWAAAAELRVLLAPSPLVFSVAAGARGQGADPVLWDFRAGLGYIF